ncbi:MAG TPA: glycosyl hydrolase, partial [Polyangiaceae bacterium]|nr:glycosyl hydrolase [Polyangiaceae bacterium]
AEAGSGGAPSPVDARERVLDYLKSISGTKTIAGQHNREPNAMPRQWTDAVRETVGQFPGLWSGDFLFQAGDIASRGVMIDEAIAQFRQGALVSLLWHACSPAQSEPCAWDGGVLGALTDPQWTELTTDGTPLNSVWKSRLDAVAVHLQTLEDADVAVLFRPLHEMNQSAFWWGGRSGPSGTRRLYQLTHDYLVETRGLTNLIWVWDVLDQVVVSELVQPARSARAAAPAPPEGALIHLVQWPKEHGHAGVFQRLEVDSDGVEPRLPRAVQGRAVGRELRPLRIGEGRRARRRPTRTARSAPASTHATAG